MREADLNTARELLKTKRDTRHLAAGLTKTMGDTSIILIGAISIEVRNSSFKEFLDKELNYTNRVLKSLGTTELT